MSNIRINFMLFLKKILRKNAVSAVELCIIIHVTLKPKIITIHFSLENA